MINRLIRPDAGTIRIDGEDIAAIEPVELRRAHRLCDPVDRPLPALDGRRQHRHRAAAPRLAARPGSRRASTSCCVSCGSSPRSSDGSYPHQLSGGQQQRVGVARALAADPEHPAHGRAVRRARPADPRRAAGRDRAASRPRRQQDDRLRHPRHRRGAAARRPHRA